MVITAAWVVVLICLALTRVMQASSLALIVLPLAAACILFASWWSVDSNAAPPPPTNPALILHIVVAMFAYALITIATVLAIIYQLQAANMRRPAQTRRLGDAPPLETLEALVFRLLTLGFMTLTLTLASGMLFSQALFGTPFEFNHHNVLALIGWLILTAILIARIRASKIPVFHNSGASSGCFFRRFAILSMSPQRTP